jgi:hypothetical protein
LEIAQRDHESSKRKVIVAERLLVKEGESHRESPFEGWTVMADRAAEACFPIARRALPLKLNARVAIVAVPRGMAITPDAGTIVAEVPGSAIAYFEEDASS